MARFTENPMIYRFEKLTRFPNLPTIQYEFLLRKPPPRRKH